MATVQITWKEPPAEAFPRSHKELVVAELKKRAGDWALVQPGMKSNTSVHTWRKLGCESVYAPAEKDAKQFDIYARWPEKAEAAPAQAQGTAAARPKTVADVPAKAIKPPAPVKPAKATLPLTTKKPADTALDPDDPKDAALLRERQRFEADRAARLAGNKTGR